MARLTIRMLKNIRINISSEKIGLL